MSEKERTTKTSINYIAEDEEGERKVETTFPWRISAIASGMDVKPAVGRSKSYSSPLIGKESMLGMVSAASVAIESDCISNPDDRLTAFFPTQLILLWLTRESLFRVKNEALDLPSDLVTEHDLLPRNPSVANPFDVKGVT